MHGDHNDGVNQPGRWLGLGFLTAGVAMIIVDSTVINVAIPSIIRDLDVSVTTAQWANTIYSLCFAALLITCGSLADIVGRRRLFQLGVALFIAASVLAGIAPSGATLIGARFLQGVAGAMILPAALSSLNATFTGRERAMAFGVWGAVIGGMVALGPLVGGWFTTNMSWRWAFFVNVPIGIAAIAGVRRWVRETRDEERPRGFDPVGVTLLGIGLAALVFATIEGNIYGWWTQRASFEIGSWQWPASLPSIIPMMYVLAAVLITATFIVERRRQALGKPVVMDLSLYRVRSFRNGNFAAMIVSLGELGLVFVLPLFLQAVLGYSAFDTGILLLALSGGAFAAGGMAARFSIAHGPRVVVITGFALEVLGIVSLALLISDSISGWAMAPSLFAYGLGVGFATAQLTGIILSDVPVRMSGQASGMQSTVRQVGAAMGIALLGSIFVGLLVHHADTRLAAVPELAQADERMVVTSIARTGGADTRTSDIDAPTVRKAATEAIDAAFVDAARVAGFAAAGFVLLGLIAALRLPKAART
jgi:EmrB/QacA subfamily drug resistance transporter